MRISDWSSDVCSSDLWKGALDHGLRAAGQERALGSQGAVTLLAGVELGGTKCVCISGTGPDDIRAMVELPTTTPDETLAAIRAVLGQWDHEALGIASFGPLDLDPSPPRYGRIVHTPKPGWNRSEEPTSELQSLMRNSYAVFCLK